MVRSSISAVFKGMMRLASRAGARYTQQNHGEVMRHCAVHRGLKPGQRDIPIFHIVTQDKLLDTESGVRDVLLVMLVLLIHPPGCRGVGVVAIDDLSNGAHPRDRSHARSWVRPAAKSLAVPVEGGGTDLNLVGGALGMLVGGLVAFATPISRRSRRTCRSARDRRHRGASAHGDRVSACTPRTTAAGLIRSRR